VVIRIDVNDLVEWTELGVPEAPQFGVLLPQGQPFGIALLKFGHGAGPQGIGTDFVDHGLFLPVAGESGDHPTRRLPLPGAILAQRSPGGKVAEAKTWFLSGRSCPCRLRITFRDLSRTVCVVSISWSSALETRLPSFFQASWPISERTSTASFQD